MNPAGYSISQLRKKKICLIGFGEIGQSVYQELFDNGTEIVCVLDDNRSSDSFTKVESLDSLETILESKNVDIVLIAISLISSQAIRNIYGIVQEYSKELLVVPEQADILNSGSQGQFSLTFRQATTQDLFGRTALEYRVKNMRDFFSNKRILITGAGGSIGSQVSSLLLSFDCEAVALLDRDDCLLHDTAVKNSGEMHHPRSPLFLCDIQNADEVDAVFEDFRPNLVIHTAAMKHVSTLEKNPALGFRVNVLGTRNLLSASRKTHVDAFLNISTDKASTKKSVLGMSKYIGERLVAGQVKESYRSVRFGNVFGSRSSVTQTFELQNRSESPIKVRGSQTTRFFMSSNEATILILNGITCQEPPGTLIYKIENEVNILELARHMNRGKSSIEIHELLPGEVEQEVLFGESETPKTTAMKNIYRVEVPPLTIEELDSEFTDMKMGEGFLDLIRKLSAG